MSMSSSARSFTILLPQPPRRFACVLRLRPQVICTLAVRGRPCSTGCLRAIRVARSSSESKIPTPTAIARNSSMASSKACAGSGSTGTRGRFTNPNAWPDIAPQPKNCSPLAPHISAIARRKNMRAATQPRMIRDDEGKGRKRRITRCSCREGRPSTPGQRPAVRFRVPLGEITRFADAVFGPQEVASEEIEDFVLLRSPRTDAPDSALPTYQLGAVVDDIDMRITHVIRGADHISNTPKQVLIYRALAAPLPIFAHVPLILGAGSHAPFQAPWRHQRRLLPRGRVFCPRRSAISWLCWAGRRVTTRNSCAPRRSSQRFSLSRRQPHQRRFRSRQARMVRPAISAKVARSTSCCPPSKAS